MIFFALLLSSGLASALFSPSFPNGLHITERPHNTTRSWRSQSGLVARSCEALCSNGGCCNTGGPCTTDGMCCFLGEIACSDGGCCAKGSMCATDNGQQVCRSLMGCKAPPVKCGSACCDAGMVCIAVGNQWRCELGPGMEPIATPVSTPELGDSFRNTTAGSGKMGAMTGVPIGSSSEPTSTDISTNTGTALPAHSSSPTPNQALELISIAVGLFVALGLWTMS